MKYALMIRNDALSKETALKIKEGLKDFFMYDDQNPDLVISIGGDGTILEAVHHYLNKDCCFVGIHTGTLGFYTDYQVDQVDQFIKDVTSREFTTMKRYLLEIKVNKKNQSETYYALNELRLDQGLQAQVIHVYINDVPVFVKGANWGMSEYMLRCRGAEYDTKIRLHKEMNFNMIRIWLGSVTDDEFY
mgnify:FL=1